MIVLVHGPDAALARSEVARIVADRDPDSANTSYLDGREVSLGQVMAAIASVGFFGGRRVVVVRDLMARAARPAAKSAAGASADDDSLTEPSLDLASLFAAAPPDNDLILVDAGLTAIPVAVKRSAPPDALIVAAEPPRGPALIDWLRAAGREAGGELDQRVAERLAETLYPQTWTKKPTNPHFDRPPDTALLRNEVERLVLAAHPGRVTKEHVNELVASGPDDRVFRFVEAVAGGKLGEAIAELERLRLAGEEPAKLTALLAQHLELAAVLAAAPNVPPVEIGRALGLSNPNRMAGIAASRRSPSPAEAFTSIEVAAATDRRLKRGRLRQPQDALYRLVVGVASVVRFGQRNGGQ